MVDCSNPETWFIEDGCQSYDNFNWLKTLYDSEKPIIIFFGAGLSDYCGVKTWKKLLEVLCKEVNIDYNLIDGNVFDQASETFRYCNELRIDPINVIRRNLNPTKQSHTPVHQMLLDGKFHAYFTTNFDNIFSDLKNKRQLSYRERIYPNFSNGQIGEKDIVYLHGNAVQTTNIIFTKEQYLDAYYHNEGFIAFIRESFINNTVLFISFSFDDRYFSEFYSEFSRFKEQHHKINKTIAPENFVLYPYPDPDNYSTLPRNYKPVLLEKMAEFKGLHLKPVFFKKIKSDGYIVLEYLIEELIRENKLPDDVDTTGDTLNVL